MASILDFLANGQQRRQRLDQAVGDFMTYITPPNLRPTAEMAAQMNPIQGMSDSMQQFGVATDPTQPADVRRRAAIGSGVEGLLAVTPAALASRGYLTPTQGLMESVIGGSPTTRQIGDDVGRFAADEAGNIRLWHGSPYDFDKFDLSNVGRGEGAQDLGRGFSLTDDQGQAILYTNPASRWGDLKAMERYRKAGSGRYYSVDVNATPEQFLDWNVPWRSQVPEGTPLFDKMLEQERKLMSIYGDDPAMAEAIPQAKLSRMWQDGAGFEDAATQSGFVGNKRRNYSGDTEYTVFDPANLSIAEKFDADGNPIRLAPDPITQRGDEILGLLQTNPASVTDDMLDMGDAVSNARLNEYLFNNYDLPMDEASRMARAREMGFDTELPLYHGTGADFAAFSPEKFQSSDYGAGGAGVYSSEMPDLASAYSDLVTRKFGGDASVIPIVTRRADAYDNGGFRNINSYEDARAYSDRMQSLGIDNVYYRDNATGQITENNTFDPRNIRSRFARFDPRLSHLRNLSAGIGGVGLLGAINQERLDQETRNYLAGGA